MTAENPLSRTPLFASVSEEVLADLSARAVRRKYREGSIVFVQGEVGKRCYAIISGSVKVSAYNDEGREAVLAVLGAGDVFGELSLFDEAPRSADAAVIEQAELLSLDKAAMTRAIADHPDLALNLLRVLSGRLRQANDALQDAVFFDVSGRLARRLADLAASHGRACDEGTLIDVPLSQESLASMVGSTRESVNKALASMSKRGLVARRGRRYVIPDVGLLRSRA
ncbi:MAG TPA: Crp/Fnr family transcriptional regulator [Actinomycetota bacterium]|nr:Crp/Fnr family transcriptional regulator [Actinomycetota bacterium]